MSSLAELQWQNCNGKTGTAELQQQNFSGRTAMAGLQWQNCNGRTAVAKLLCHSKCTADLPIIYGAALGVSLGGGGGLRRGAPARLI